MTHWFMASRLFKVFAPIGKIGTANAWSRTAPRLIVMAIFRSTVSQKLLFLRNLYSVDDKMSVNHEEQ